LLYCQIARLLKVKKPFNNLTIKYLNKGFTLIELIITIAIIVILSMAGIFIFSNYPAKARDGKRKIELKQIADGLGLYYADRGYYPPQSSAGLGQGFLFGCGQPPNPTIVLPGQPWNCTDVSNTPSNYMRKLPKDPRPTKLTNGGILAGYMYLPILPGSLFCFVETSCFYPPKYKLGVCLENKDDSKGIIGGVFFSELGGFKCPVTSSLYTINSP